MGATHRQPIIDAAHSTQATIVTCHRCSPRWRLSSVSLSLSGLFQVSRQAAERRLADVVSGAEKLSSESDAKQADYIRLKEGLATAQEVSIISGSPSSPGFASSSCPA